MKKAIKNLNKKAKNISGKISKSKCFNFICNKDHLKYFAVIIILVFIGFLVYRGLSNSVVVSQSEIIRRVSKHVDLPNTDPLSVVRVDNAENLRKQSYFYDNINEGDYIVAYRTIVVIYDLRNDKITRVTRSK